MQLLGTNLIRLESDGFRAPSESDVCWLGLKAHEGHCFAHRLTGSVSFMWGTASQFPRSISLMLLTLLHIFYGFLPEALCGGRFVNL
mmetsp:Transcript_44678/g.77768  ORF Transcript_44678/g.77768 Transcript_44678/m.77768 type:complete len:87 (+) Transcript_44678:253-513(+)